MIYVKVFFDFIIKFDGTPKRLPISTKFSDPKSMFHFVTIHWPKEMVNTKKNLLCMHVNNSWFKTEH